MTAKHEVVISGIAGQFPESYDMQEFCDNLYNKVDMVTSDNRRWLPGELDVPSGTGKLKHREFFDFGFFNINSRLAEIMDPNTKLLIEQAFRAICDSGMSLKDLSGSNTAVFMSSFTSETEDLFLSEQDQGTYGLVAHSRTMQANRISFFLNLKGPSAAVDSSWSGGMEALQRAYDSIAIGESVAAVVGSSSLIFAPHLSYHYQAMGRLSEDSMTRSFSADANGYARSEGCVVLFLQRAEHARRSYGSILGIHSVAFGSKNHPFTEFSGEDYKKLLEDAYRKAKVNPSDVGFVEANGSASPIVDAKELNAISEVFLPGRRKPLLIGSVKSNAGHAEAASSLVSLAKAVLALDKGLIPPNIHYNSPNPGVPSLMNGQLQVVTETQPLPSEIVGVSSVGLSAPYSHVIIKQNPKPKAVVLSQGELPADGLPRLVLLTDRNPENIIESQKKLEESPIDPEFISLMNNFAREGVRGYLHRGYTVLNGSPNNYKHNDAYGAGLGQRPVWFMFSGMGSQWPGMAKSLMNLPVFASAIHRCHQTLLPKGIDLLDAVTNDNPSVFDNILNAFVGIAAVQIGLVDVLRSVGVHPDGIVGHSLGEQGCGYADGCFTLEQMILSAWARGKASLDAKLIKGMMAAVGMGYQQIKDKLPGNVEVACHNSSTSCTLSGPAEEVSAYVDQLKSEGIFAKPVNVGDIAFHSKNMKPAGTLLVKYLSEVIPEPKKRSSKWISSSNPEDRWDTELAQYCSAEYHANNMLSPVLFEEATSHIPADAIVLEIAPHALLQAIVKKSLSTATHIPLTSRFDSDGLMYLLGALGKMYIAGIPVQVDKLYPAVELPVSRGTPFLSPFIGFEHKEEFNYVRAKADVISCYKELDVNLRDESYVRLISYQMGGKHLIPDSFYLEHIIEMFTSFKKCTGAAVLLENLRFENTIEASFYSFLDLLFKVQSGTGQFCVTVDDTEKVLTKGKISILDTKKVDPSVWAVSWKEDFDLEIEGSHFISLLRYQGLQLDGDFANIKKVQIKDQVIQAVIQWKGKFMEFLNSAFTIVSFMESKKSCELHLLKSANELVLDPSMFTNRPDPSIFIEYNSSTKILQCIGMRLLLPETKAPEVSTIQEASAHFSCELTQFVPFVNSHVYPVPVLLELCVQLIAENANQEGNFPIKVITIGGAFHKELQEVVSSPKYSEKLELVNMASEVEFSEQGTSTIHQEVLWVVSSVTLKPSTVQTMESALRSFFLLPTQNSSRCQIMNEVSQFTLSDGSKLSLNVLLKEETKKIYETVNFDTCDLKHLEQKLDEAFNANVAVDCERHAVLTHSVVTSISSALQIIDETSSIRHHNLLRYALVDDPKFDPKTATSQIEKDLKLNVKMNGVWGTLRFVPADTAESGLLNDVYTSTPVYPLDSVDATNDISSLGLNLSDLTGAVEDKTIKAFDYATQSDIGVSTFDPVSKKLTRDDVLQWKRPKSWSDAEAASVPVLFTLASYIVHVIDNPAPSRSILVNRGLMLLSQAIISLALYEKLEVYVTVYGESEKKTLLNLFPSLKSENVFDCNKNTFHVDVLQKTKGKGVNKVVNTFAEDVMIEPCVQCTSVRGTFVQVSLSPMMNNSKMGMLFFDGEVIAFGATIDIVLGASVELKKQIRDYLQKALVSGHVRPLRDTVVLPHATTNMDAARLMKNSKTKAVIDLKNKSKGTSPTNMFVCDSSQNYLIIAGQTSSDFWLKLTEWLLRRGARRISVVLKQPNLSPALALRLKTLSISYPTSRIYLRPINQVGDKASVEHFLDDLECSGEICTIFILGATIKDNITTLDQVLMEKGLKCGLVCLGNGAEKHCERRKKEGLRSLCIRCSPTVLETPSFLQRLDELMVKCKKNPVVSLHRYNLQNNPLHEKSGSEWNHVPTSLPELQDLLRLSSNKPVFVEVCTNTARKDLLREIDPVYIIPGLRINQAQRIAEKMHCPAFIARLPADCVDIEYLASDLAKQMITSRQNLFTLISDDWGGALALHVASKLQIFGKMASVILLDGAPTTTRAWATKILNDDLAIFKKYTKLTPKVMLKLKELSSWEAKIQTVLENSADKAEALKTVQSLTILRNRLQGIIDVKPPAKRVRVLCHLFRFGQALKSDQCGLKDYLQRKASIHVKEVDNASDLIDSVTHDLNELVLFEYKDAAYPPDEKSLGTGFLADMHIPSSGLSMVHKFLT